MTLHNEEELQRFYTPLAAIAPTSSKDSNPSDLSKGDDELKLFCWVLNGSNEPFSIMIRETETVYDLKKAIKKEEGPELDHLATGSIKLWKLSPPIPSDKIGVKLGHVRSPEQILGCAILDPADALVEHFQTPPKKHIHVIVQLPAVASRKHFSLSPEEDNRAAKRERNAKPVIQREWTVKGAIREIDISGCYYLDPGRQVESTHCLNAVSERRFALLWGARASGKTTRLFWLQKRLIAMGYQALYISFERVQFDNIGAFWTSFSTAVTTAAAQSTFGLPQDSLTVVSRQFEFIELFRANAWGRGVVLLIDEFGEMDRAEPNIRDDCLRAFRELRNNNSMYAIDSVIAAGTLSILYMTPSNGTISPFFHVQNPYFTIEEVRELFHEFAQDHHITIDSAIVEDIWAKSNGHPAMVCLCGRTVFKNLLSLSDSNSTRVSYRNWQQFPADELYYSISAYNTFKSMLTSLARPEAAAAVILLRSRFVGFLDEVELEADVEQKLGDFLTSEGALLKPDPLRPYYCMASPLLDGLIRNTLIPDQFPDSPSSIPPLQDPGKGLHVLGVLIESLKYFDKTLIRLAASCSYKTSKVKISGAPDGCVPRESVYDTELMRILSNWLRNRYYYKVIGQWHVQTHMKKHRYSQRTPECMALLSANEAWVVHFTCELDYHPVWQSDAELLSGINVVAHDLNFQKVVMSARWKDLAGNIQHEDRRLLTV